MNNGPRLMPPSDCNPATWTDLMRLKECRASVGASRERLHRLLADRANPMDIVHERIELRAAEWRLRQLESKFRIVPECF